MHADNSPISSPDQLGESNQRKTERSRVEKGMAMIRLVQICPKMLFIEQFHRCRQDHMRQDQKSRLSTDHHLLLCSHQYAEKFVESAENPVAVPSSINTVDRHVRYASARRDSGNLIGLPVQFKVNLIGRDQSCHSC
jgi:hypothetical protein